MANSFAIAVPSTLIPLLIGSAAAYALVWLPFRGSAFLFFGIVALIAVPVYGVLIPILQAFVAGVHLTLPFIDKTVTLVPALGLAGSIPGVWSIHVGTQLPFAVLLLVFAAARVPRSLIDAARLDGASHAQIYWRVVMPPITPTLAALGVLLFLCAWNDSVVALTIIGGNGVNFPATVRFTSIGSASDGPVIMAMIFVHSSVALAVFFGLQRSFLRGLLTGVDETRPPSRSARASGSRYPIWRPRLRFEREPFTNSSRRLRYRGRRRPTSPTARTATKVASLARRRRG